MWADRVLADLSFSADALPIILACISVAGTIIAGDRRARRRALTTVARGQDDDDPTFRQPEIARLDRLEEHVEGLRGWKDDTLDWRNSVLNPWRRVVDRRLGALERQIGFTRGSPDEGGDPGSGEGT